MKLNGEEEEQRSTITWWSVAVVDNIFNISYEMNVKLVLRKKMNDIFSPYLFFYSIKKIKKNVPAKLVHWIYFKQSRINWVRVKGGINLYTICTRTLDSLIFFVIWKD